MIKKIVVASLAGALAFAVPTAASAAVQIISFGGNLDYGWSGSSPFGVPNSSLGGLDYEVSFSYDPTQFDIPDATFAINSCGPNPGTSCFMTFSATRAATETIRVGAVTRVYTLTSGGINFTSNGAGSDFLGISLQGGGVNFNVTVQDGNSIFPNQNNVHNPVLNNGTVAVSGNFSQEGPVGYSMGDSVTSVTFSSGAVGGVPEPATWMMMLIGFGIVGFGLRRRGSVKTTVSYA